jgi:hypothetical protein
LAQDVSNAPGTIEVPALADLDFASVSTSQLVMSLLTKFPATRGEDIAKTLVEDQLGCNAGVNASDNCANVACPFDVARTWAIRSQFTVLPTKKRSLPTFSN